MSASRMRVLGLVAISAWLAAGCAEGKKIDVGTPCMLNSQCSSPLACTMGKCHDACHTSADCPVGQSCITASDQSKVCQLPAETHCVYNSDCQTPLICAADLRCRNQCQGDVDCSPGQTCTTTQTCAEPNQVDSNNNLFAPDGGVRGSGGASGTDGPGSCPTGVEGCSCYPNDTCNVGLTCASHLCVSFGAGGASGTGGSINRNLDASPGLSADVPGSPGGASSVGGAGGGVPGTGGSISGHSDASSGLSADVPGSTGGVASVGGVVGTGGVASAGGVVGKGGVASTGGVMSRGGVVVNSGGATSSGGAPSTGGIANAGGATKPLVTGGNSGHYQMENLDRGVVAVKVSGGVYVGWRMFGYEYDTTASNVSYNLYRDGTKVANVTDSTNYLDAAGTASSSYTVAAVIQGTEGAQCPAVTPWGQQYLSIPITPPTGSYSANDGSPGDLDGDGKLDIVLKWDPANSKDSASSGTTDPVYIDGYTLAGKKLWSINVGSNIRAGAHDTQFSVYDFDGDGKAEVAFKTAPGTKDGNGNFLSNGPAAGADNTKDYRGARGMALGGPEWLTVFDGATGAELATVDYPVPYGTASWGDLNGNRSHRYNGGVSFVKDGGVATGRPSIIQQRGYYTRLTVSALTFRNGALATNWIFDSNVSGNSAAAGQGNHSCMTGDADGDGAMEIIPGSSTINSDGTLRCTTTVGHGDALHVGILVKGKGLHVFMPHENDGGHDCHSADTCAPTFITVASGDNGRGVADWVSMSNTTGASCSSGQGNVNCADGSSGAPSAGNNFLIFWNGDEARSPMNGTTLPGVSTSGTSSCNGTKSTPTLTADLLGDWREEAVLRETSNAALRVYTTVNVTNRRIYTLMHDPTYRAQVSFEQSSYNQPPHVGFHLGAGMADPPVPDIYVK